MYQKKKKTLWEACGECYLLVFR